MDKEIKEVLNDLVKDWEGADLKPIALATHSYRLAQKEFKSKIVEILESEGCITERIKQWEKMMEEKLR